MTLDEAIRDRLLATTGVTGHVGSGAAARIYPGRIDQGASLPAIRYTRISEIQPNHLGGLVGYGNSVVQIDSYAANYADALDLDERVRVGLATWGPADAGSGFRIHSAQLESRTGPTWSTPIDASEQGRWETSIDIRVQHSETITVA